MTRWKQEQHVTKNHCPSQEIRRKAARGSRAQIYVNWLNKIIRSDTSQCTTLLKQMKDQLKFPKDIETMIQTSSFLTNRFAAHGGEQNVLEPVGKQRNKIYW